ncbi:S-layer homology domain-containing protein [Ruminiclostridium cellulolyticum]|uniref:S-layer domain protein n=1 Tax=Ruminiclostridium cellulolyticum (strain ATCC 35319 / DSM 5812 / JCM 6584 / H10) TaxID=394503 RepID=B8I5J0_RUMCH|nr:S-layer homology domain-containing protein [Ruminiclostridium cellulolyticum]ACL76726.1 S-layer domain protein [Ruminiclostridium cellulolyticum H10]
MKKFMKKFAVLLIGATLILSGINTQYVSAAGFKDVKSTDWYYSSVNRLVNSGITSGVGSNSFGPEKIVTRSEMVTFLCKAIGLTPSDGDTFLDITKHWAKKWITAAVTANIIDQGEIFGPDEAITRQEATEMLCRALGLSAETLNETPFCDITTDTGYCTRAFEEYLMLGSVKDNERYFYPFSFLKRSEAAAIIVNLLDYKSDKDSFKAQKKVLLDKQEKETPTTKKIQQIEVTVSTPDELIKQIGSNKRILLKPGVYNLSSIKQLDNKDKTVTWRQVDDGKELNLSGIHNLTIEGINNQTAEIKVNPRYAEIINFNYCKNITLKNIKAGHTPSEYTCNAGVLSFTNCSDIEVNNSELYGCGSVGISAYSTKRLNCVDTIINHCSLRAINLSKSEKINFTGCKILNHEAYSNIVNIYSSKEVTFEKCEFTDNNNFEWGFFEVWQNTELLIDKCKIVNNFQPRYDTQDASAYFFKTQEFDGVSTSKITVKDTEITNNRCDYLCDDKNSVTFENCTISGNEWEE